MTIPYTFESHGKGIIIRKVDGNADTKFLLYTDKGSSYGFYTDDHGFYDATYKLNPLARPETFEYYNAGDGRYYRISLADIRRALKTENTPVQPEPLKVRWHGWFGESTVEIHIRLLKQRDDAIQKVIRQARERKEREEENKRREEEETANRESVESEWNSKQIPYEEALKNALADAGLSDWAD